MLPRHYMLSRFVLVSNLIVVAFCLSATPTVPALASRFEGSVLPVLFTSQLCSGSEAMADQPAVFQQFLEFLEWKESAGSIKPPDPRTVEADKPVEE